MTTPSFWSWFFDGLKRLPKELFDAVKEWILEQERSTTELAVGMLFCLSSSCVILGALLFASFFVCLIALPFLIFGFILFTHGAYLDEYKLELLKKKYELSKEK